MRVAAAVSPEIDEKVQELLALARLLTYAKETAGSLEADVAAFCIDAAIKAVLEQVSGDGVDALKLEDFISQKAEARC